MNIADKNHLPILEAIESTSETSQRSISEKTDLSLGLVNQVLQDLIKRGWVRAQRIPRKRFVYYLTPKGFSEKSRLAMQVFENTINAYQQARYLSNEKAQEFITQGCREVALFGSGPRLELAYLACLQVGLKIQGIYDEATAGTLTLGAEVNRPEKCPEGISHWYVGR